MPVLTFFFDTTLDDGLQRVHANLAREKNRLDLEAMSFHHKVYEGYQQLLEKFPNRIKTVQANQAVDEVLSDAFEYIMSYIGEEDE